MARKTVQEIIATDDVNQTRDWITSASIPELKEFIHTAGRWTKHSIMTDLARAELSILAAEASERVHWTVKPTFWITVIACLAAIVAAVASVRVEIRDYLHDQKAHHAVSPASQVPPPLPNSPSNSPALKP